MPAYVYQDLADELAALGVRHAHTFLSRDIAKLVAELGLRGVRIHHARHEHVAVGMADGYARVSGELGVALIGQGVGLTNALNGILTAVKAHARILILVGEVPGGHSDAAALQRKHLDQRALLDTLGITHIDLTSATTARADLAAAARQAILGPVVVSLPEEVLEAVAGDGPTAIPDPELGGALSGPDATAIIAAIDDAHERGSGRIVILGGRGAVRAGARASLERLGQVTGALLGTSIHAKGLFAGAPSDLGVIGGLATPLARELLADADLVLAFGASLSYDQTVDGTVFGGAPIIQIDHRPGPLQRFGPVHQAVVADARIAADQLVAILTARPAAALASPDVATIARLAAFTMADTFTDASGADGLDMRALTVDLDRRLPRERTVVVDGGSCKYYPITFLTVADAAGFVWPTEYGAIGISVGAALGAAIARPDRLVVLCTGDGGLMMTLGDLETAAREGLRMVVVVYNNMGLVAEVNYLIEEGYSGDEARYANPSFAAVARGLGFDAIDVRELADLEGLEARVEGLDRPLLLDCRVMSRRLRPDYVSYARRHALEQAAPGLVTGA